MSKTGSGFQVMESINQSRNEEEEEEEVFGLEFCLTHPGFLFLYLHTYIYIYMLCAINFCVLILMLSQILCFIVLQSLSVFELDKIFRVFIKICRLNEN